MSERSELFSTLLLPVLMALEFYQSCFYRQCDFAKRVE